jgi:HD-GYP domain-containing protein (c-di-GMP phosphodiesterase class II)
LLGRILAIADAYSAMTSDRPYRQALTEKDAMLELQRGAGSQFDPHLVDTALSVLSKKDEIADTPAGLVPDELV